MYCKKCGRELERETFCPICGDVAMQDKTQAQNDNLVKSAMNFGTSKNVPIVSIGVGILAVVILVICLFSCSGSNSVTGYRKTIDNYFKAHETNDANLMYSSVTAKYWLSFYAYAWGEDAPYEALEDSIDDTIDDWGCGDVVDITYNVAYERKANTDELWELENYIYDEYASWVMDREDFSITDAYVVEVDYTVVGSYDTDSFSRKFLLIKENGDWGITRGMINSSLLD